MPDTERHQEEHRRCVHAVDRDLRVKGCRQAREGSSGARVQADRIRNDSVSFGMGNASLQRGRGFPRSPTDRHGGRAGCLLGGRVVQARGEGGCGLGDLVEVVADLGANRRGDGS